MAPKQLSDVWLASNWSATTGWAEKTGRSYDISLAGYGRDNWSVACNQERIGPGTIGWIARSDGSWGHLAGIMAMSGPPGKPDADSVTYVPGRLFPLPRDWWLDGARLYLSGWGTQPPFGLSNSDRRVARLQSGQVVPQELVGLMTEELHPVAADWIKDQRANAVTQGWTDDELLASVRAYRRMFDTSKTGGKESKSQVRKELLAGALSARSKASFEYRMANISAVLEEHGAAWLPGYKPAPNVGKKVKTRLIPLLQAEGLL